MEFRVLLIQHVYFVWSLSQGAVKALRFVFIFLSGDRAGGVMVADMSGIF